MKKVLVVSVMAMMAVTSTRADIATDAYVDSVLATASPDMTNKQDKLTSTNVTSGQGPVVTGVTASDGLSVTKGQIAENDISANAINNSNMIVANAVQTAAIADSTITNGQVANISANNAGIALTQIDLPSAVNNITGTGALIRYRATSSDPWVYKWEHIDRPSND